jgi:hypothetical protein
MRKFVYFNKMSQLYFEKKITNLAPVIWWVKPHFEFKQPRAESKWSLQATGFSGKNSTSFTVQHSDSLPLLRQYLEYIQVLIMNTVKTYWSMLYSTTKNLAIYYTHLSKRWWIVVAVKAPPINKSELVIKHWASSQSNKDKTFISKLWFKNRYKNS